MSTEDEEEAVREKMEICLVGNEGQLEDEGETEGLIQEIQDDYDVMETLVEMRKSIQESTLPPGVVLDGGVIVS